MLYNIFEESKEKRNIKKLMIIVDIHEKDSLVLSELKNSKDINMIIDSLKIGDYIINDIVIERKTISDLISSIVSKRIFEQIRQLSNCEKKILLLEGEIDDIKNSRFNPNSIRGFLLSLIINQNIPIIFTKDYFDTSRYLILLAKQESKKPREFSFHSRIPKTLPEQKQYILESFPNIGPKKADLLLNKYRSLHNIFNADEEDLKNILGINSKKFLDLLRN